MKKYAISFLFSCLLPFFLNGFDIVKDGQATAYITAADELPSRVMESIERFRNDVRELTAAEIPWRQAKENKMEIIHIKCNIDSDNVAAISFPDKNTMRIEGGTYGLARIFPFLLERFAGVVYLYPGKNGTHYPNIKNLAVPDKSFTFKPVFDLNRALSNQDNVFLDTLGAKWAIDCQHYIPRYILPIKEYLQTKRWPAAEVFPVIKGKRLNMKKEYKKFAPSYQSDFQPCHTSPQSVAEAVKNIGNYLQRHPETTSISLAPNDNRGYCECETCAKLNSARTKPAIRMFGPDYLYRDHSQSYFQWCNRIVAELGKKYPDIRFGALAYRETHMAPDFKLDPRITVYLCFDFGCTQYTDVRRRFNQWVAEWERTGATLGVWEYGFGDSYYTLPRIGFRHQAEMFRFLADNGFRAFFGEGAESLADGPKRYLYMKLMENPYADIDVLLQEWYDACIGKEAAPYLRQYFDFWETYWPEKASRTTFSESRNAVYHTMTPFGPYMYGLGKSDMPHCRKLMEKMLAAAKKNGSEAQKIRAHNLMLAFEYFESGAQACFAGILPPSGTPENPAQALAVLRALPDAERAYKKRQAVMKQCSTDPALAWWRGIRKMEQKQNASPTEKAVALTAGFAYDPYVREELRRIARDKSISLTTRHIANTIVKSQKENNLLFENPEFVSLARNKHTVVFPVKNGEWQHDIPVRQGKYLVRMKITIPEGDAIGSNTWINLRLQGRTAYRKPAGAYLDTPKITPKAGQAYMIYNTITLDKRANYLQITANLFHFKPGTKVVISDLAVIALSDEK